MQGKSSYGSRVLRGEAGFRATGSWLRVPGFRAHEFWGGCTRVLSRGTVLPLSAGGEEAGSMQHCHV